MRKVTVEVERDGAARGVEFSGIFGKKVGKTFYSNIEEIPEKEKAEVLLTDFLTTEKLYDLSTLKHSLIRKALNQMVIKDIRLFLPGQEVGWVASKVNSSKEGIRYLVSIVSGETLNSLQGFSSLTTTSQAINLIISGKTEKTFMLIHSFGKTAIILTFFNGFLDYIRGIEINESFEENVDLTIQYYKEQRKVQIDEICCSGDIVRENPFKKYSPKPISSIIGVLGTGLPEDEFSEFLVPIAAGFVEKELEHFYSQAGKGVKVSFLLLSSLFLLSSLLPLYSYSSLKEKEKPLLRKLQELNDLSLSLDSNISKVQRKILALQTFRKSKFYSYITKTKRLEVPELIDYIKNSNRKLKVYILNASLKNGKLLLETLIAASGEEASKNLSAFLGLLSSSPFIKRVYLIDNRLERFGLISTFEIEVKGKSYAGD